MCKLAPAPDSKNSFAFCSALRESCRNCENPIFFVYEIWIDKEFLKGENKLPINNFKRNTGHHCNIHSITLRADAINEFVKKSYFPSAKKRKKKQHQTSQGKPEDKSEKIL